MQAKETKIEGFGCDCGSSPHHLHNNEGRARKERKTAVSVSSVYTFVCFALQPPRHLIHILTHTYTHTQLRIISGWESPQQQANQPANQQQHVISNQPQGWLEQHSKYARCMCCVIVRV